ncbi:MAG TPA: oligopeptide:H+ symporter [Saprospiraceae bacterium]|nr:oligopeptide:H+ symporter [Saprospiraceae bacterium]
MTSQVQSFFEGKVMNHPAGLFVLFFTEMWERFSYYGMRALMVLFLTASLMDGGYGWERENALELYGFYTGLVYFTPLFGGMIADKVLGYKSAVVYGAFIMALGHASLALEIPFFFYFGLLLLIIGNGLFKPNIASIVGQMYVNQDEKKDAAYTIFYMGVNAGAFFGILLCGYIGEKIGWGYGFGLAGIFMFFGMLQFYFGQGIYGSIGERPEKHIELKEDDTHPVSRLRTPKIFQSSRLFQWLGVVVIIFVSIYIFLPAREWMAPLIFASVTGITGFIVSDPSLTRIEKDRVWVIFILAFFIIFFWWAFEQAGGSMTIFARDYTDRVLTGGVAATFKFINTLLTIVPLAIITWVLFRLFNVTYRHYKLSNQFLGLSFVIIWVIVIMMLAREWKSEVTEVPASWFGILNAFFIISFAPLFSRLWDARIITSGAVKFALGLFLLGLGFAVLSFGSIDIPQGAKTASVSMIFLILAYLFHTLGELCISPVGLSYVSKLSPVRLVGVMFGVYYIANFVANWSAGKTGSYIDKISEAYSMSTFFLIFTAIPIIAGVVMLLINKKLKKMMHGVDE